MGLPATLDTLKTQLTESARRNTGGGDMVFLKFAKGDWSYGAEEMEIEEGSLWAVNPLSFSDGFQAWGREGTPQEGELLGEEFASLQEPAIIKSQLPREDENGAPLDWKAASGVEMACVSGEDEGLQVRFQTNSYGGNKAIAGLKKAVLTQINKGSDEVVPLVVLEVDSYKHKKYGKVYTPEIVVREWRTMDDAGPGAVTDDEADAEIEGDEPQDDEKPKRQRRRRA